MPRRQSSKAGELFCQKTTRSCLLISWGSQGVPLDLLPSSVIMWASWCCSVIYADQFSLVSIAPASLLQSGASLICEGGQLWAAGCASSHSCSPSAPSPPAGHSFCRAGAALWASIFPNFIPIGMWRVGRRLSRCAPLAPSQSVFLAGIAPLLVNKLPPPEFPALSLCPSSKMHPGVANGMCTLVFGASSTSSGAQRAAIWILQLPARKNKSVFRHWDGIRAQIKHFYAAKTFSWLFVWPRSFLAVQGVPIHGYSIFCPSIYCLEVTHLGKVYKDVCEIFE